MTDKTTAEELARVMCCNDPTDCLDNATIPNCRWRDYLPDAQAILPFLTAERELGRVEGARAMQDAAATLTEPKERRCKSPGCLCAVHWAVPDAIRTLDPTEIAKEIGNEIL